MINDTHLTYKHDGTPHSLTFDGVVYTPDTLRMLIRRGTELPWLLSLALIVGAVIGIALTLAFLVWPGHLDFIADFNRRKNMSRSDGSCLNDSLSQLVGYDVGLPDWVMGEENREIARRFGLRYFENTTLSHDGNEPIVFVIPTCSGKAHAVYVAPGQFDKFYAWNTAPILCAFMR